MAQSKQSSADDVCEITCVDRTKVERVKAAMEDEAIEHMVSMFKGLADKNRMKIVQALAYEGELCVCDTAHIIEASIASTSHHLRTLRKLGLAKYRKEGKLVYYSLDDSHVEEMAKLATIHQKEMADRKTEQ
ncbi:cadmium-sensing regulator, CadC [Alteribacillus persepolensis]|uniref:Cadmium-sensing regulator, CadC n=1 Tax=Alteribacillus persepolensis TaxID=568899 RepID=A0A1G8AYQ7_9BACI|nr:metalloregulator ArsR/SmtB family transcription factor [Alteribacillus persepolensis]SDH26004.1 cadmium-sensing regulator, CadC [Alteribacillus persepolensis]